MQLLASMTSPYVRKVRIVVREKELTDQVEEVMIKTSPLDTDERLKTLNPLGKIPCLVLDDDTAVMDSRVICSHLDNMGSGSILQATGNIRHSTLVALADGILDASVSIAYEKRVRPPSYYYEPWVEAQWAKISRSLKYIDESYLDILAHFNMASIGMICALDYLDFRMPDHDWRVIAPKLADWHKAHEDRPSVMETRPQE